MEVLRGTDRLVIPVGKNVFKLPRASVSRAFETTVDAYGFGMKAVCRQWGRGPDIYQSPQWFLLHGVVANRREAALASDFPDIVIRTRMLGGGVLNVQPRAERINLSSYDVADIFAAHMKGKVAFIGHMVENASNFGMCDDGQVRFLDGGSDNLENVLRNRGEYQRVGAALQELTRLSL